VGVYVAKEFPQIDWAAVEEDCREIVRLAIREDLDRDSDWTTIALIPPGAVGQADVVARHGGVIAGLTAVRTAIEESAAKLELVTDLSDGDWIEGRQPVATIRGSIRDLLTLERICLNLLGRMAGVATLTRSYVEAIQGRRARLYDTRKTIPGWRRLDKYAVRCGGGHNHRWGLYGGVLIKDNHLAYAAEAGMSPAQAIERARDVLGQALGSATAADMIVEVEVDTEAQLRNVLPAKPDIVLLDNFTPQGLQRCVAVRNELAAEVQLEASGGVNLATVLAIADSGVDRISVGTLTHSAPNFDFGLDWA
jgi:nicotinate-nucleotide pyrophosphorylase (carboxylating)